MKNATIKLKWQQQNKKRTTKQKTQQQNIKRNNKIKNAQQKKQSENPNSKTANLRSKSILNECMPYIAVLSLNAFVCGFVVFWGFFLAAWSFSTWIICGHFMRVTKRTNSSTTVPVDDPSTLIRSSNKLHLSYCSQANCLF